MIDRIIAVLALAGLAVFLGVFVVRLPRETDLLIVLGVVFLMAAADFAITLFRRRRQGPR
jgi:Ni,Fe-hydrogenase III small subunit